MTGADIIGELVRADSAIITIVPIGSIKAKRLPDGVTLPALLVRVVTAVDQQLLDGEESARRTDRVAVTVRARNGEEQDQIIRMVRACCAGKGGDIAGATDVSIRTAGLGPDVAGPNNSFEQTQDFRVGFNPPVSSGDQP